MHKAITLLVLILRNTAWKSKLYSSKLTEISDYVIIIKKIKIILILNMDFFFRYVQTSLATCVWYVML